MVVERMYNSLVLLTDAVSERVILKRQLSELQEEIQTWRYEYRTLASQSSSASNSPRESSDEPDLG